MTRTESPDRKRALVTSPEPSPLPPLPTTSPLSSSPPSPLPPRSSAPPRPPSHSPPHPNAHPTFPPPPPSEPAPQPPEPAPQPVPAAPRVAGVTHLSLRSPGRDILTARVNTGPVGFLEALPHFIKLFESLPIAVLIQEAHLPVGRLDKARALVHRLLPAYSLFAGRPRRGPGHPTQIQVVTLVHVYMAARASLLDVRTQYEAVTQSAPEGLQHEHFIKMSDPWSDATLLLGNLYQFQAAQPVVCQ